MVRSVVVDGIEIKLLAVTAMPLSFIANELITKFAGTRDACARCC